MRRVVLLAVGVLATLGDLQAGPAPTYFEMIQMPGGYRVAREEVTQAQYEEISGENPSAFPDPARPVDSVSWDDAVAFCKKLTAREAAAGRLPEGWSYALPTDAQWDEFSAGASVAGAVTSLEKARDSTAAAGASPPNALGLRDVIGNVWEWCADWYTDAIRRKDSNPDVPPGALVAGQPEEQVYKVLRGGAWDTSPSDNFSLAARLRYAPGMSNYHTGFRCILLPPAANAAGG